MVRRKKKAEPTLSGLLRLAVRGDQNSSWLLTVFGAILHSIIGLHEFLHDFQERFR